MKFATIFLLFIGVFSRTEAANIQAMIADQMAAADNALVSTVAIPPVFQRSLQGAAVAVEARIVPSQLGKLTRESDGQFATIGRFKTADGRTGDKAHGHTILIRGLKNIPLKSDIQLVIYPCGTYAYSVEYAITPLLAYHLVRERTSRMSTGAAASISMQTVINRDRAIWDIPRPPAP